MTKLAAVLHPTKGAGFHEKMGVLMHTVKVDRVHLAHPGLGSYKCSTWAAIEELLEEWHPDYKTIDDLVANFQNGSGMENTGPFRKWLF